MPASWQLPPGVTHGLWDYLHDPAIARDYDAQLADTPLLRHDREFVFRHVSEPGRFIDLGCGTGRLSIPLAERGHHVVAVDLSAEMLRVAGVKAAAAGAHIDRVQANLVELMCFGDKTFDAAACLFSTLGMVAGAENRRRVLENVHRLLRPGGTFVLHVHNRWFHLGTQAGRRLLGRNLRQAVTGRAKLGDFEMPPHQGVGSFPMHLFSRREVVGLLRETGFKIVEVQPVGVEGPLRRPWLLATARAYGYLVAARA
jgi:SAM-dependent methyltransferase